MLAHKPHTCIVYAPVEQTVEASYRVLGVEYGWVAAVRGQVTPMGSSQAYEATGIEIERPHMMLWDAAVDVPAQSLVEMGGRWFLARAGQQIWDAEPITAHRSIVLAEIDAEAVEAAHELHA